jgi:hypothetical protein
MPIIYIVKFRQGNAEAFAHWGIFLPNEDCSCDDDGIPTLGTLFHASKAGQKCLNLGIPDVTQFHRVDNCNLRQLNTLMQCLPLADTTLVPTKIADACDQVTLDRNFWYMTQNCQEWVKEVLRGLVKDGHIDDTVFVKMKRHGFVTLRESCVNCSRRSSSFNNCKCWQNVYRVDTA